MDSHSVRRAWAERSGEYSPDYYAYYGPNETSEALASVLGSLVERDAPVLELGCSAGRHLAHLRDAGFTDLTGVDINGDALTVMTQAYPALAAESDLHEGAMQEVLPSFETDAFAVAFSVETLQHVHPDDDEVFADLARVADAVVTVENETAAPGEVTYVRDDLPLYHRDWHAIFTDLGFAAGPTRTLGADTLRVFS